MLEYRWVVIDRERIGRGMHIYIYIYAAFGFGTFGFWGRR